jgi:hypothetical protein
LKGDFDVGFVYDNYRRVHTLFRRIRLHRLKRKYNFDSWHTVPIIWKPYVKDIVAYISEYPVGGVLVECGCGLGDIVGNKKLEKIYKKNCLGVDMSSGVIGAARELHPHVEFLVGSFVDIKEKEIAYLVAVNFTHMLDVSTMKNYLNGCCNNNVVKNIIVDEVTGDYKYTHDYEKLCSSLDVPYTLTKVMGPYVSAGGGSRYIKVFTKKMEEDKT